MSPNFIYGILGSIVGTTLTVAVYSIVNSGSDTEITTEPTITNSLHSSILQPTTTGIATKITTEPTISNLLHSSITQHTTNSGTHGLHSS